MVPSKSRLIFSMDDSGNVSVQVPLERESKGVGVLKKKKRTNAKTARTKAATVSDEAQILDILGHFKSRGLLGEKDGVLWLYPGFDLDRYREEDENLDTFIGKITVVLKRKRVLSWKVNDFWQKELNHWMTQSKTMGNLFVADFMRHLSLLVDHKLRHACSINIGKKPAQEELIFLFK